MATHMKTISFSPKGTYLAHSGIDGRLKIWNTQSSILVQEYTPSSHLSTTCSCLVWCPVRNTNQFKTAKKKKKLSNPETEEKLLALGTTSGNILLYNVSKGELHSQLEDGHRNVVNDVSWHTETDSLFSCSNDQYVVHWSITSNKVKHKWKADRHHIYAVSVVDENTLLSASLKIKWWDIKTRTVLKNFTGHASEVFSILPVGLPDKASEASYFLSAAIGDRVVNAWQLKHNNDPNAVSSFTLSDEPVNMEVCTSVSKDENMLLTVVTSAGILQVFGHQQNGKCKTPSKPKYTIQVACEEKRNASRKTKSLPILAAHICPESKNEILIVYGSLLKPVFEKIQLTECKTQTVLIREFSSHIIMKEKEIDVYKQDTDTNITNLVPGVMAPTLAGSKRRKKRSLSQDDTHDQELSLGEQVDTISKPKADESPPVLSANTMVEVLTQGLQSEDQLLLNRVFGSNAEVMTQTIKMLPPSVIPPLLNHLQQKLHLTSYGNRINYLRWLKTVILLHTTHVTKCQEIGDILTPVSHILASRGDTFQKLLQLKGRLGLILSQMELGRQERLETSVEPLMIYQEESDEEQDLDVILSQSESEENWDEENDSSNGEEEEEDDDDDNSSSHYSEEN